MNAIDETFQNLKRARRKAFMPFLAAGDPDLALTVQALATLAANGASLIEVGVPFSDPVADGPVIQASYTRALSNGFTVDRLFASVKQAAVAVPLVAMASYSLIYRRGVVKFVADAQAAGFSGAVVPDLPVQEAAELAAAALASDFKLILLVTPTTSPERAEAIVNVCTGFVYVVSVMGITGARATVAADLHAMLARLRTLTDLPLCVGFGVSTPQQAGEVGAVADGVIVGSALVKLLSEPDPLPALARASAALAAALEINQR